LIANRPQSPRRADPADREFFDPIRAASYHASLGNHDEACWLVFLFVHFGKNLKTGWNLLGEVYGRLGQDGSWDWSSVSMNPAAFEHWIAAHTQILRSVGGFGNHRKYESITTTGRTVASYVAWVGQAGHQARFAVALDEARSAFDVLYRSMKVVQRFGRLAKFDYLTMIGKLALAPIEPESTYLDGATGPVAGARLLLGGETVSDWPTSRLDERLVDLDSHLKVGMQALEDALCNWQKSPDHFISFRG
jgi:hypothetical protein